MDTPEQPQASDSTDTDHATTGPARTRRGFLKHAAATGVLGLSFLGGCQTLLDTPASTPSQPSPTTDPSPTATPTPPPSPAATPSSTPPPTTRPTATPPPTTRPTATPLPTATRTAPSTQAPPQTQHSPTPAQLATYTNEVYRYQIDYPSTWVVDERAPNNTYINSNDLHGRLLIQVIPIEEYAGGQSGSLSTMVRKVLSDTRDDVEKLTVSDKETLTLDSGQQAYMMHLSYADPASTPSQGRSLFLVTKLDEFVYEAEFIYPTRFYTDETEKLATQLVTSFTLGS